MHESQYLELHCEPLSTNDDAKAFIAYHVKVLLMRYQRNRFVVQEHFASHHHYDFRLEMDGVLKSWAIPKEVPRIKKVKRLAVQVDDHDVDYIGFEGEIAEGLYGAGTVRIFDSGCYYLLERNEDKIKVVLLGEKLEGVYELIRLKDTRNWLIFVIGDRAHVVDSQVGTSL